MSIRTRTIAILAVLARLTCSYLGRPPQPETTQYNAAEPRRLSIRPSTIMPLDDAKAKRTCPGGLSLTRIFVARASTLTRYHEALWPEPVGL